MRAIVFKTIEEFETLNLKLVEWLRTAILDFNAEKWTEPITDKQGNYIMNIADQRLNEFDFTDYLIEEINTNDTERFTYDD